MKKIFLVLIPFFVLEFASAKPVVSSSISHYKIYPKNRYQFSEQMDIHSPTKKYGFTQWDVRWNYTPKVKANRCTISNLKVKLNVKIIMPQIPLGHWVKLKDRKAFDRFYKALLKHERGHERIASIAAQEVERNIKNIKAKDCAKLEKAVDKKAKSVVTKYRLRGDQYEESSKHKGNEQRLLSKYL